MALFDLNVLKRKEGELVIDFNELLDDIAPEGKNQYNFTGGYIQQLKNSNQLVAYFGTKKDTNNRDTVKVTIEEDELDLFYVMLKAKIHSMKQVKTKTVRISMAKRKLDKQKNIDPDMIGE